MVDCLVTGEHGAPCQASLCDFRGHEFPRTLKTIKIWVNKPDLQGKGDKPIIIGSADDSSA